jgi:hypothetical protein
MVIAPDAVAVIDPSLSEDIVDVPVEVPVIVAAVRVPPELAVKVAAEPVKEMDALSSPVAVTAVVKSDEKVTDEPVARPVTAPFTIEDPNFVTSTVNDEAAISSAAKLPVVVVPAAVVKALKLTTTFSIPLTTGVAVISSVAVIVSVSLSEEERSTYISFA